MTEQKQMATNRMPRRPGARPAEPAVILTPKEIFGIVRRHIWLIVVMTILGLMISGISWFLVRRYAPKYTARTLIRVLPPVQRDPMAIGERVVAKDIQYGYRLSMAALVSQQGTLDKLIRRDKVQATKWFRKFGKVKEESITEAIKDLNKNMRASAQRESNFVVISMRCGNKIEAALIVNEMVDLFLNLRGTAKREEVTDKLTKLGSQRLRVQRDLDSAERSLEDVRGRWGLTDIGGENRFQHTITLRLNDLELEQNELLLRIREAQAFIDTLSRRAAEPINEQVENQIERDPIMVLLAQQLVLRQAGLASKLTRFGENHRVVRQDQELINEIREKRRLRRIEIADQTRISNLENAKDELIILTRRFEELTKMKDETQARKRDLDIARVQFAQRETIRDEREEMLNSIKSQIEKLKIVHDDPETPKVKFVAKAPIPLAMSSPRWQVYFPAGIMLGFMLGIGLAFLIELLNDLVRTPRDVNRHLHIPLLGFVPHADEDEYIENIDLCHVVSKAPYSIISESYRQFRTNLKLSNPAETLKVILVSSSVAGDGKTSVVSNLAAAFVADSKTVLLIDANFRRPALHAVFQIEKTDGDETPSQPEFGLSNILMGQCAQHDAIKQSGIEGLDMICSGQLPSNPTELLGSSKMEELVKQQRDNYDYVIIDSAPALLASDAKILAGFVDKTVLVFNATTTRRGVAQRTIRELKEVNAEIAGCVLFAVKTIKGGYFQEQFKSYQEYHELRLVNTS
ncbi:MAG: polysaccharide biosynthesis tyrosine autokinase [Planctomycetes bacterium]|nr:polysaccharide biosynthesis tyrosine autokinase [Planctomycetota bacterium]